MKFIRMFQVFSRDAVLFYYFEAITELRSSAWYFLGIKDGNSHELSGELWLSLVNRA